ncbi:MAG: hypothetical protein WCX31_16155 [Salinivirgaceae bacterium]
MKKKGNLIFVLSISLLLISCNEITREECNVNDDYKYFTCPTGYETLNDIDVQKAFWINIDSCEYSFDQGCGLKILDTTSYFQKIDTNSYNYYNPTDDFWDFESNMVVGLAFRTDYGLNSYSSIFLCVNNQTKEILIRCQYEVSDQCAGSEIYSLSIAYWISIKKQYKDYKLIFSIENSNPL